jgi:hypothetical protein
LPVHPAQTQTALMSSDGPPQDFRYDTKIKPTYLNFLPAYAFLEIASNRIGNRKSWLDRR